ncbi:hypothetical protein GCM10007276_17520 [Agaricicola taiwanensis]|uniref:Flagellar protein FlbB n=1 Tax=Agaricicola taiwanensis TaxID=591372 RepID=A0A8J2VSX3_9RHOB|nr:flagellar protein FlbB [Agaricicola taiwanensis]GGE40670.1 hypothetical protein GCM10007276_17520 [Agaricicola taiwanensis]
MSGVRVLPLVVASALAVLTLKVIGVASGEGWALRLDNNAAASRGPDLTYRPVAWAHDALTVGSAQAGEGKSVLKDPVITGSTPTPEAPAEAAEATTPTEGAAPSAEAVPPSNPLQNSDSPDRTTPGERAVLERLTERRNELEEKAKEIEMRDSLLKAAEKRIEARIKELEAIEARIAATKPADAAEGEEAGGEDEVSPAKVKDLVTMYENMRPKDAAKIFDELNLRVLVDVVKQMNPRKMSEVLAKMTPSAAQRLTVELAGSGRRPAAPTAAVETLPQIPGIPTQP